MQSTVDVRRAALAACFATVLGLAACGGGDGGTPADPPSGPPAPPPSGPVAPQPFLQDFAAASVVFGQDGFTNGAPNSGSAFPDAFSLFDPAGVAVADDGRVFIADAANRRVLVLPQVPESLESRAAFALGQPDVFSGGPIPETDGYTAPRSVAIGAGRVAVADPQAHRVLIYESIPVDGNARPTVVVGQPDFDTQDGECDEFSLNSPDAAYITPGGKLIVADAGNSRLLVWNSVPTSPDHGKKADLVLGQPDFTHCAQNAGGGQVPARNTMRGPSGVWSDGMRLAVVDTGNHRVLLWDDIRDLHSGQEPSRVLGQPDFASAVLNGPDRHTLTFPRAVTSNGTHLAVSDGRNRVLLWNAWPSRNGQPADNVIGQRDFLQNVDDDANESAQSLDSPYGITFHQDKLLVVDEGNNRLLIFKSD